MQRLHPSRAAHARPAVSWRKIRAALHSETGAFVAGSTALVAVPLVTIWLLLSLDGQSMATHGWGAVALGTVGSSALTSGLMAALFASDPGGHDGRIGDGRGNGP